MRNVSRPLLRAGVLVVVLGSGLAALAGAPVAEFDVIWDGALSSSQAPTDDSQWQWLRGRGVNTIVNLDDRMVDFGKHGFEDFLWIPLAAGAVPGEARAERFLKFVQLSDNRPAHISGAAREGRAAVVALLRYAVDGWSIERALAEGQRVNGGAVLPPPQATWLQGWAARHKPGSHRLRPRSTLGSMGDSTQEVAT